MATVVDPNNETTTGTSENPMEDLSGVDTSAYHNPYDALISKANGTDNPPQFIQEAYETHRTIRNATKKAEMISPDFGGIVLDQYLSNRLIDKDYVDPRNSLVFWARPPEEVLSLATKIQTIIKEVMSSMWLMPPEDMHTTVLEVVHSVTMEEVMELGNKLAPIIDELAALPKAGYGCTLFKPMVSFDASAIALSFVPCGEAPSPAPHQPPNLGPESSRASSQTPSMDFSARPSFASTPGPSTPGPLTSVGLTHSTPRSIADLTQTILSVPPWHTNPSDGHLVPTIYPTNDYSTQPSSSSAYVDPSHTHPTNPYSTQPPFSTSHAERRPTTSHSQKTYHHLRAALHSRITTAGVPITSRYVVPSAHITLARYVTSSASSASSAYNTDLRKSDDELSHKNLVCLVHTIELINAYLSLSRENDSRSAFALGSYERIEIAARSVLNIHNNAYSGPLLAPALRSLEARSELSEMGEVRWDVKEELVCRVGDLWYGGGVTVKTQEKGRVWKRGGAGTWWECGDDGVRGRAMGGREPLAGKAREKKGSAEGVWGEFDDERLKC